MPEKSPPRVPFLHRKNAMKITVLSTGTIETWLHLHARPLKRAENIRISVPVPCYLIEHGGKKFLFDAGQKPLKKVQDPLAMYLVKVKPGETAVELLAAKGIAASNIDYVIISHAHSDHYAGLVDFPQAKVIAQSAAAESLKKVFPNEFITVDGKYDCLNDGAMLCIPTPGHAPGHQSLLLTRDDGSRILLVGDVVYMPEAVDYEPDAGEYAGNPGYFDSIRLLRTMQADGVELCFGHDPYTLVQL